MDLYCRILPLIGSDISGNERLPTTTGCSHELVVAVYSIVVMWWRCVERVEVCIDREVIAKKL